MVLFSHCGYTALRCFTNPPLRTITPEASSEQDTVSQQEKNPLISTLETFFFSICLFEIEIEKKKRWKEQRKQQGAECKQGTDTSSNLGGRNARTFLPSHLGEHILLSPHPFHSAHSIPDIFYRCHHLERYAAPQRDQAGIITPPWRRVLPPDAETFFKLTTASFHFIAFCRFVKNIQIFFISCQSTQSLP